MLSLEQLKVLNPLNELDGDVLVQLADVANVEDLHKGQCLFHHGSDDDSKVYLIDGELELIAGDGRARMVSTDSRPVSQAIASLVPRQYTVTATKPSQIVRFDHNTFESLVNGEQPVVNLAEVESETNLVKTESGVESELFTQIFMDITNETFELPNLPEVASRTLSLLRDEDVDIHQLENIIQGDPAITARLIKVANSAMFSGQVDITSVSQAVVRIGLDTTSQMVMGFAMQDLFVSDSKTIKNRMKMLWYHSICVASVATALSKKLSKFDPGTALLAGLVHDIGEVAVLSYMDKNNMQLSGDDMDLAQRHLRGDVGSMILSRWNFPSVFSDVAEDAEEWQRVHEGEADLADLILIAQLHAEIHNPILGKVPTMSRLPAFKKLGLSTWTPEEGIEILKEAEKDIKEMIQLFKS